MAEAHRTSVSVTDAASIDGPSSNPVQHRVDALEQELVDMKSTLQSLMKVIEDLKEAIPTKIEVKDEPLELGDILEAIPASAHQDDSDNEQMEVEAQIAATPPRRQSTEEPIWTTPSREDVLFRVNPEYARRIASRNGVVAEPVRVPTPPETREETPPLPPRSPPPPPAVRPTGPIGIIPTSQAKRKYKFELIIEVPSKRFKPTSSSDAPAASSGRNVSDSSVAVPTRPPVRKHRPTPATGRIICRVPPFKVDLDPKIRDISVTRGFMSAQYGTLRSLSFNKPRQHRVDAHGYDHFVFVCEEQNPPQAPPAPGEPGLVTLFDENAWPTLELYRLFVRKKRHPSLWQYMGLYTAKKLPAWTPAEIKQQSYAVKTAWARRVKYSAWGHPIIARMILRTRLGREPTTAEVEGQLEKLKGIRLPSLNAITAAFEKGEEKLYPWELQCKGYEKELQWEIAVAFPNYKETPKSPRKVESVPQ